MGIITNNYRVILPDVFNAQHRNELVHDLTQRYVMTELKEKIHYDRT